MACRTDAQDTVIDQILKNRPPSGAPFKYDPVSKEVDMRAIAARKLSSEAFTLMDQGNFQKAEKLFLQAHVIDDPESYTQEDTLLGLAEVCNCEKRYAEAAGYFHALYSRKGGSAIGLSARVHMEYALTLADMERWPEAVEEYEQALVRIAVMVPEYQKAVKSMEATAREGATPGRPRHIILEEAMPREEMFQYLPPEWSVRFSPDRPRYDAFKAITHLFIGTNNAGFRYVPDAVLLAHVRDAIGYDPKNAFAYYEYGMALNKAQQYTDAKTAFVKAQQLSGSNVALADKIKPALADAEIRIEMLKQMTIQHAKATRQKTP